MKVEKIDIKNYSYSLPENKIAKYPLDDREQSKLLIYKRDKQIFHKKFTNLPDYINPGSLIIYNNTRVIHARLNFYKNTGARIELFCLSPHSPSEYNQAFQTTNNCIWSCMVGNLKKWKDDILNLEVETNKGIIKLFAEKSGHDEQNNLLIKFNWTGNITFAEVLNLAGKIPIPPYLNRKSEDIDTTRYQTVYSQFDGSVAAPTAGLHFTENVFKKLCSKGIETTNVVLHVGAGTFQPVKAENALEHKMHGEQIIIKKELLEKLLLCEGDIIATGTTTMRTLESIYWLGVKLIENKDINHLKQWDWKELNSNYSLRKSLEELLSYLNTKNLDYFTAITEIMIIPGYEFKVVDVLITNFHQPQSTLILLVAAFIGDDWHYVYKYALNNNFRFLSYGDSSILFRHKQER